MENMPKVGDLVTIDVKSPSNLLDVEFSYRTYSNVPVAAHSYPKTISVQVDIKYPGFIHKVAEIPMRWITKMVVTETNWPKGKLGEVKLPSVEELRKQIIFIKGSTGNKYIVVLEGGVATACTCPGFHFRKHCRHLKEAEAQIQLDAPKTVDMKPDKLRSGT